MCDSMSASDGVEIKRQIDTISQKAVMGFGNAIGNSATRTYNTYNDSSLQCFVLVGLTPNAKS